MRGTLQHRLAAFARRGGLAVFAVAAAATLAQAEAPSRDTRTWGPVDGVTVTFSVPETYADCTSAGLTDALTTTGIPDHWYLTGQVNVGYIGPAGTFVITQVIPVNVFGNLSLQITYPPHSAIQTTPGGIIEYHVEPQIEVYDGPVKVWWVGGDPVNAPGTLGPNGQDWDVFCLAPPPPPPPPTGDQGCTPGYWKQPHHFDSWPAGVTPATSFESIFGNIPGDDLPFLFALDGGGGPGIAGALSILRRAAAAAYLNAASNGVHYGLSPAQVVAQVYNAATSGHRGTILDLATTLDQLNNKGCPLN